MRELGCLDVLVQRKICVIWILLVVVALGFPSTLVGRRGKQSFMRFLEELEKPSVTPVCLDSFPSPEVINYLGENHQVVVCHAAKVGRGRVTQPAARGHACLHFEALPTLVLAVLRTPRENILGAFGDHLVGVDEVACTESS